MLHLRFQSKPWAMQFVTTRCLQGFNFLRPSPKVNQITAGVLAYSLQLHSETIKLHHYVFLSNHLHFILSSSDAKALAQFMCHFKSNLARELGRIHDWHGPLWQSRYAKDEILDEASLIQAYKYIFSNSVKEGLVDHPRDWPGLHGYHQLCRGRTVEGGWVNRERLYHAKQTKKGQDLTEEDFTIKLNIHLSRPDLWLDWSDELYRERCEAWVDEVTQEASSERVTPVMGISRICREPVLEARIVKRCPRPLCRAKCMELLKAYKRAYYEFKAMFQEASALLRRSLSESCVSPIVVFPEGGIPLFGGG